MKPKYSPLDFLPIIVMLACIFAGLYVAGLIYDEHQPISRGFVGIAFFVMAYRVYLSAARLSTDEPTRNLFSFPVGFKYLGLGVVLAILSFWALNQTLDMIFYLLGMFFN